MQVRFPPARIEDSTSSTPALIPPVNGRDLNGNTMGLPRAYVSSNCSPFALALQHKSPR